MAAITQLKETQRKQLTKARALAGNDLQRTTPLNSSWDPYKTATISDVAVSPGKQYAVPFPMDPNTVNPNSTICPAMKAGLVPYARSDVVTQHRPGKRNLTPKSSITTAMDTFKLDATVRPPKISDAVDFRDTDAFKTTETLVTTSKWSPSKPTGYRADQSTDVSWSQQY
eukprot:m.269535 g.269535  ORF g.269535 m.269535 type:complete len:170 (-) comp84842_c0_seq1:33-542(-)